MSNFMNKVKNALDPDRGTTIDDGYNANNSYNTNNGYNTQTGHTTSNVPEGTYGPHSSRVANAADPRVDSDLDRSGYPVTGQTGLTGSHATGQPVTGQTIGGQTTTGGVPEGTAGPHKSRAANALDPRVDSDLDGSRQTAVGTGTGTGVTGHQPQYANTGTGVGNTGIGSGTTGVSNTGVGTGTGPVHSSKLANKLDPRVDSSANASVNTTNDGYSAPVTRASAAANAANAGPSSAAANATPHGATANAAPNTAPVVEHHHHHHHHHNGPGTTTSTTGTSSTLPSSTGVERQYVGSNTAPGTGNFSNTGNVSNTTGNTTGPHSSSLLNKLDPRVDSSVSGTDTYGRNTNIVDHKDPLDASQVPPSVMREHVGEPVIMHDDKNHGYSERHGSASHQETHI